jgi:hypothetical protein
MIHISEATEEAACARYYRIKETLSPFKQDSAEFARGQASAYVWGRQDAGETFHGFVGDAFAWDYASMRARSDRDNTLGVGLRDSWESFRAHGEIRDYSGRNLVSES